MRLNIRCCCQPTKIFGTLEVPAGSIDRMGFNVCLAGPVPKLSTQIPNTLTSTQFHHIQIKPFGPVMGIKEWAVYSDDRPIEFWRKLPGFKEGDCAPQTIY